MAQSSGLLARVAVTGTLLVGTVALLAGLDLRHRAVMADLVEAYRAEQHDHSLQVLDDLEDTLRPIYEGVRTMSRLPGVRRTLEGGRPLAADAARTVQELYNNLASGVALSEVYLVPLGLDPDAPAGARAPREPVLTFDALIVDRDAAGETEEEGPEVEEIELYEYRAMRAQLARLGRLAPTEPASLAVPLVGSPVVVTCDNSHFDPAHPDDAARAGIVLSAPVYGEAGTLVGMVSAVLRADALAELLPDGGYVVRDPDSDVSLGRRDDRAWDAGRADLRAARPAADVLHSEVLPVPLAPGEDDWFLWVRRPDVGFATRADVSGERTFFRAAVAAVAVAGLLVAVLAWRSMDRSDAERRRVAAVLDVASAAAGGRLDLPIPPSGPDTVGRLSGAVGEVLRSMRDALGLAGAAGTRLDAAAARLDAGCAGITRAAREAADEARAARGGAEEVAGEVGRIAADLEALSEAVRSVAVQAAESQDRAGVGVTRVDEATGCARRLSDASEEIRGMVHVIEAITEATRMLALNASIEASRAGVAGRGFSVVAREVGTLSEQTAVAARTIRERVDAIVREVGTATRVIGELGEVVHDISSRQAGIAAAVEEQSATTRGVAEAAARGADSAEHIRAALARLESATGITAEGAVAITDASGAVVHTAAELTATTRRYVLEEGRAA